MTSIQKLGEFGQSAWLDNISRDHILSGKLKQMIDQGVLGETSNPSIFNNSISKSSDYDTSISELVNKGLLTFDIYDELTVKDVQDAADIFAEVYDFTSGRDGYISIEVSPKLANKTSDTIEEARRLWKKVNKKNVMIKVPATKAGIPAIKQLISEGININATLIFSVQQYKDVANAYVEGLSDFVEKGGDPKSIASVASVFVSRIDALVDKLLVEALETEPDKKDVIDDLTGKAAIANAKIVYQEFLKIFGSKKFKILESKGAKVQRPLWASTGTKNPAYSDIKYVTELIAKNTVNTLPDKTYEAFLDHGEVKEAISLDINEAGETIKGLKKLDIDIDRVCDQLLREGVDAFENAFDSLLGSIEQKMKQVVEKKE